MIEAQAYVRKGQWWHRNVGLGPVKVDCVGRTYIYVTEGVFDLRFTIPRSEFFREYSKGKNPVLPEFDPLPVEDITQVFSVTSDILELGQTWGSYNRSSATITEILNRGMGVKYTTARSAGMEFSLSANTFRSMYPVFITKVLPAITIEPEDRVLEVGAFYERIVQLQGCLDVGNRVILLGFEENYVTYQFTPNATSVFSLRVDDFWLTFRKEVPILDALVLPPTLDPVITLSSPLTFQSYKESYKGFLPFISETIPINQELAALRQEVSLLKDLLRESFTLHTQRPKGYGDCMGRIKAVLEK
jgi:hypothetical protein